MDERLKDAGLIEFFTARLDDMEGGADDKREDDGGRCEYLLGWHLEPHEVRHLIDSMRAVVAWYADSLATADRFRKRLGTGTHMEVAAESYLNVIKAHAAAWSSHPDYHAEWAPPAYDPAS